MIISRICGGLGNQMFQYAMGRRVSLAKKDSLLLDVSAYQGVSLHDTSVNARPLHLKYLSIQASLAFDWQSAVIQATPQGENAVVKGIKETSVTCDLSVLNCDDRHIYLDGYWQTESYFRDVSDTIRSDFALLEPMTEARKKIAESMAQCESVSVHVRRGDYVSDPTINAYHGTCSPEWYKQAMSMMAVELKDLRFFVFSDDPDWARDNLPKYENSVFIDPQPDGHSYEDMHLMASCKNHITANSSFSWWGAWLNPSPIKKVIAPKRWVMAEIDQQDRVPSSWQTL